MCRIIAKVLTVRWLVLSWLLLAFLLIGCQADTTDSSWNNTRRLIVSHTWGGNDADLLESILANFAADNPDVALTVQRLGESSMAAADFEQQAAAGLGADVLIGLQNPDMVALYKAGLIVDLTTLIDPANDVDAALLGAVQLDNKLLGAPFSATTTVVYYNVDQITVRPASLDSLIQIADQGHRVAINIDPLVSLWGIRRQAANFIVRMVPWDSTATMPTKRGLAGYKAPALTPTLCSTMITTRCSNSLNRPILGY